MKKKLVVVADDFTGANDTGVQFRKAGLKVNVIINTYQLKEDLADTDVLVIDLESRFDTKELAYQKCYHLGKQLYEIGNIIVYKKLDSTLRGNIGAEIDGLMDSLHIRVALVAPALPSNGRTSHNGEVYVHGVKLENTEVINDPRTPVSHSGVADIIHLQSTRKCSEVSTGIFEVSAVKANELVLQEIESGSQIIIFDALEEKDLQNITHLINNISDLPILMAGSAGLANHLREIPFIRPDRLNFVFSGSVSDRSGSQIRYAVNKGNCRLYLIKGEDLLNQELRSEELIRAVLDDISKRETRFIFTSAVQREDAEKVFDAAQAKGITKDAAAGLVAISLGKLAAMLIERFRPSGVLLTGGDIAINTVLSLKATGINIDSEILPGIQSGMLTGCPIKSVIATKAGGFGEEDAIFKTLEFLT